MLRLVNSEIVRFTTKECETFDRFNLNLRHVHSEKQLESLLARWSEQTVKVKPQLFFDFMEFVKQNQFLMPFTSQLRIGS